MGEMIQKKFREMLDSVSSASDEFVNKYFSDDSVDLNIDANSDTDEIEDEDVETIKGENTDDWFNYNDLEKEDNLINNDTNEELNIDDIEENNNYVDQEVIIKEDVPVFNEETNNYVSDNSEIDIEADIIPSEAIEKEILDATSNLEEELNLNYDYTDFEKQISESNEDKQISNDNKKNESIEEKNNEKVETVKDTQYKKLSSDELIKLLNKTDNGEEFFKEVEVVND